MKYMAAVVVVFILQWSPAQAEWRVQYGQYDGPEQYAAILEGIKIQTLEKTTKARMSINVSFAVHQRQTLAL